MTMIMNATYNGQVLQLDEPLDLEPNTRVRVSIEPIEPKLGEPYSFLDFLASLELRGPTDWSERIEDYSEGFPQDAPNLS